MGDKLDKAMAEFEDEESGIPLSVKINNLRSAFMWNAFETMKRIKKHGTKSPVSEEEEYKQVEGMRQFRIIERMYESQLKSAKIQGKGSEDVDKEYLNRIKQKKSTIGDIVRDTK